MKNMLSTQALDLFKQVEDGSDTEFAGLHPWQSEKLRKACSAIAEGINFACGNHWTILNCNESDFVSVYFAGLDKSGAKAELLGLANQPRVLWIPNDEGSDFPAPAVITLESAVSPRVAVVLISYTERDMRGYGVFSTAEFHLLDIAACFDEAAMWAQRFVGAIKELRAAASLTAEYAERKQSDATVTYGSGSF